jgi:hypothetical protein
LQANLRMNYREIEIRQIGKLFRALKYTIDSHYWNISVIKDSNEGGYGERYLFRKKHLLFHIMHFLREMVPNKTEIIGIVIRMNRNIFNAILENEYTIGSGQIVSVYISHEFDGGLNLHLTNHPTTYRLNKWKTKKLIGHFRRV